jgi:hypothetical protein
MTDHRQWGKMSHFRQQRPPQELQAQTYVQVEVPCTPGEFRGTVGRGTFEVPPTAGSPLEVQLHFDRTSRQGRGTISAQPVRWCCQPPPRKTLTAAIFALPVGIGSQPVRARPAHVAKAHDLLAGGPPSLLSVLRRLPTFWPIGMSFKSGSAGEVAQRFSWPGTPRSHRTALTPP